jgi:hypothetical protein
MNPLPVSGSSQPPCPQALLEALERLVYRKDILVAYRRASQNNEQHLGYLRRSRLNAVDDQSIAAITDEIEAIIALELELERRVLPENQARYDELLRDIRHRFGAVTIVQNDMSGSIEMATIATGEDRFCGFVQEEEAYHDRSRVTLLRYGQMRRGSDDAMSDRPRLSSIAITDRPYPPNQRLSLYGVGVEQRTFEQELPHMRVTRRGLFEWGHLVQGTIDIEIETVVETDAKPRAVWVTMREYEVRNGRRKSGEMGGGVYEFEFQGTSVAYRVDVVPSGYTRSKIYTAVGNWDNSGYDVRNIRAFFDVRQQGLGSRVYESPADNQGRQEVGGRTLYLNDHVVYIGDLDDQGSREGQGTEYDKDGRVAYTGQFSDGEYLGNGILYEPGSTRLRYEGEFANGKYEGRGTLYEYKRDYLFSTSIGVFVNGNLSNRGQVFDRFGRLFMSGAAYDSSNTAIQPYMIHDPVRVYYANGRLKFVGKVNTFHSDSDSLDIQDTYGPQRSGALYSETIDGLRLYEGPFDEHTFSMPTEVDARRVQETTWTVVYTGRRGPVGSTTERGTLMYLRGVLTRPEGEYVYGVDATPLVFANIFDPATNSDRIIYHGVVRVDYDAQSSTSPYIVQPREGLFLDGVPATLFWRQNPNVVVGRHLPILGDGDMDYVLERWTIPLFRQTTFQLLC